MYSASVNSVTSERAFSIQNLIHAKACNALLSNHVNKLTFSYINSRVFHAIEANGGLRHKRSPTAVNVKEEAELENEILEVAEEINKECSDVETDDDMELNEESEDEDEDEEEEDFDMLE